MKSKKADNQPQGIEHQLFADIKQMIDESRMATSQFVNARLTLLYWSVGKRINEEILGNERAEYGRQIVASLSRQLEMEYGKGYSEKNLRRAMQFQQVFPDFEIVASLIRQLSWLVSSGVHHRVFAHRTAETKTASVCPILQKTD